MNTFQKPVASVQTILAAIVTFASFSGSLGAPSFELAQAQDNPENRGGNTETGKSTGLRLAHIVKRDFVPLFAEENLKQWRQCGPGRFTMTNGMATGEGGMSLWWYAGR